MSKFGQYLAADMIVEYGDLMLDESITKNDVSVAVDLISKLIPVLSVIIEGTMTPQWKLYLTTFSKSLGVVKHILKHY